MKFGLDDNTISEIRAVFNQYPKVDGVLIYGSRAIGNYRPGSDIDLAVLGPQLTQSETLKIAADLEDLETLYRFDVLLYDKLKDNELKEHIDRVGQNFYQAQVDQR